MLSLLVQNVPGVEQLIFPLGWRAGSAPIIRWTQLLCPWPWSKSYDHTEFVDIDGHSADRYRSESPCPSAVLVSTRRSDPTGNRSRAAALRIAEQAPS